MKARPKVQAAVVRKVHELATETIDLPRLVEVYRAGRLRLDAVITKRYRLASIEQAFADMEAGMVARGVIVFDQAYCRKPLSIESLFKENQHERETCREERGHHGGTGI